MNRRPAGPPGVNSIVPVLVSLLVERSARGRGQDLELSTAAVDVDSPGVDGGVTGVARHSRVDVDDDPGRNGSLELARAAAGKLPVARCCRSKSSRRCRRSWKDRLFTSVPAAIWLPLAGSKRDWFTSTDPPPLITPPLPLTNLAERTRRLLPGETLIVPVCLWESPAAAPGPLDAGLGRVDVDCPLVDQPTEDRPRRGVGGRASRELIVPVLVRPFSRRLGLESLIVSGTPGSRG